jgi:hypothetical protein
MRKIHCYVFTLGEPTMMEAKHLPILALFVCVGPRAVHSLVIVLRLGPLSTATCTGKAKYRNPDSGDQISE